MRSPKYPTPWRISAVVPATAGFETLDSTLQLGDPPGYPREFYRQPVVAWIIETCRVDPHGELRSHVTPVTIEGYGPSYLLRMPDGRVIEPECAEWDTEEAALETLRERWRATEGAPS